MWEQLSEKEKKEFQQMLKDGRLGNMLELWEPWWNKKVGHFVSSVLKFSGAIDQI